MTRPSFKAAHAAADDWSTCVRRVADGLGPPSPDDTLGFVYVTEDLAGDLASIVGTLRRTTGVPHWVGGVGLVVAATGTEYHSGRAMSVLVTDLPAESFAVLGPVSAINQDLAPATAGWLKAGGALLGVVHGDPANPDLPDVLADLAARTSGYLLGGLTAVPGVPAQVADKVVDGGLSGVLLGPGVDVSVGLTQGCTPLGPARTVTEAEGNVLISLDHRPALEVLKADIGEVMARLGAEMRHVDQGRPVGRLQNHHRAGGQRLQPLAQPQHRQRAEQPDRIDHLVRLHAARPSPAPALRPPATAL